MLRFVLKESLFQSFLKCAVIKMCAGHVYSPGSLESKASAELLFLVWRVAFGVEYD
jgi:hypothetical protein